MSIPCPAVAGGLIAEKKLFLALAGVLATLIFVLPCESTGSGNSPLGSQGRGQWREEVSRSGGSPWVPWTLSPLPSEQPALRPWRPRSFATA